MGLKRMEWHMVRQVKIILILTIRFYSELDLIFFMQRSDHWNRVPEREREKMGLNFDEDGEFW